MRDIVLLFLVLAFLPAALFSQDEDPSGELQRFLIEKNPDVNENLINVLVSVNRMSFLPSNLHVMAWEDIHLPVGDSTILPSPSDCLEFIKRIPVRLNARILVIGPGAGYMSAILARFSMSVFCVDRSPGSYQRTREYINTITSRNLILYNTIPPYKDLKDIGFDVIILHGSVPEIPSKLFELANPDGIILGSVSDGTGIQYFNMYSKTADSISVRFSHRGFFPFFNLDIR